LVLIEKAARSLRDSMQKGENDEFHLKSRWSRFPSKYAIFKGD